MMWMFKYLVAITMGGLSILILGSCGRIENESMDSAVQCSYDSIELQEFVEFVRKNNLTVVSRYNSIHIGDNLSTGKRSIVITKEDDSLKFSASDTSWIKPTAFYCEFSEFIFSNNVSFAKSKDSIVVVDICGKSIV